MSVAALNNLAVLLEIMQLTRNLAMDMNGNAAKWHAWAAAGSPYTQAELAADMTRAGASYRKILAQGSAFVAANNAAATGALGLIQSTLSDLSAYVTPLSGVANGLQTADLSTFANIMTACDQITSVVTGPPTLWTG